ncbi:MAG: hypothetical protein JXA07_06945 [Spirochaetes bacterium]|nr:hypothetical protein [Spirochaetota bacterium]
MKMTEKQFARLLERYALSRPVSPENQRAIMKKRRAGLKHILKQKGSYGAFFGAAVTVSLLFKKMGINLSLIQSKIIAGLTATAVSAGSVAGGYATADYVKKKIEERKKTEREREKSVIDESLSILNSERAIRIYYHKLEEINLDDGTRLIGAVISQKDGIARIHTVHGVIEVPVKSIKTIRML